MFEDDGMIFPNEVVAEHAGVERRAPDKDRDIDSCDNIDVNDNVYQKFLKSEGLNLTTPSSVINVTRLYGGCFWLAVLFCARGCHQIPPLSQESLSRARALSCSFLLKTIMHVIQQHASRR
jgi:hypothetical protein